MNPQAIAASPLICIYPSLINLEEKGGARRRAYPLRRAPKMIRFPPSLTDQLAALIGQEYAGGHQDRAADHEGLTQQLGRIARGGHRRLPSRGLGLCLRMLGLVRHLRDGLGLLAVSAVGGLLASDLGVKLGNSLGRARPWRRCSWRAPPSMPAPRHPSQPRRHRVRPWRSRHARRHRGPQRSWR